MTLNSALKLDTVSPHRSLIFCAIGAVAGLAIAGFGLFTSSGTRTSMVPAQDVAVVNGVPILMTDYVSNIQSTYQVPLSQATAKQKKDMLETMIREELYVQRGIELGLPTDSTEVRSALVTGVESMQTTDVISMPVSDQELQAWYQAHMAQYNTEGTMRADDYVTPDLATAEAGVQALRAGRPVPAGLKKSLLFADGNEFYFAAQIHLGPELFKAAAPLKNSEVSTPVKTADGYHVLVMVLNDPPVAQPFDSIRDRVLQDVNEAKSNHLMKSAGAFLRKRADVLIAKGFE
ncbi:MAG: peptidyl-prolyl cis-trans isomerase [Asticcacaulis sp.]|uniref:peptidylprolyl isomerase n=1 Tax=Asticcacaulis sp. TaxID=1872648 RepID=UPI0039E4B1CC